MLRSGGDLDNAGGHVRYLRKPVGPRFRVSVLIACLLVGVGVQATLSTPAYPCSIAAFPKDAPAIRFTGRAVKHELTIDSGPLSSTFDWTFVVTKWDRSSAGQRRKVGTKITISVVQSSANPTPTTPLPDGVVRPCDGTQFGVTTEFLERGTYNVVAIVHEATNQKQYIVSNFVGSLTSTGNKPSTPLVAAPAPPGPNRPNETLIDDRQVACLQGPVFSSAILRKAPKSLTRSSDPIDQQIVAALSGQNSDQNAEFGSYVRQPVRFLGVKDGYLRVYLKGKERGDIVFVDTKTLRFSRSSPCRIRAVVGDRPALRWWIHKQAPKITSATKELRVLVQDSDCGGGGDSLPPRLLTSVTVTAKTVEVAFGARPIELPQPTNPDGTQLLGPDGKRVAAAATCEGYPPNDITITLPVALGKRQLIDASHYLLRPASRYAYKSIFPPAE